MASAFGTCTEWSTLACLAIRPQSEFDTKPKSFFYYLWVLLMVCPFCSADIMQFSVYNIGREANHDENVSPSEYSLLRVASVTAKSPNVSEIPAGSHRIFKITCFSQISLFDNLRIQTAAVGTPRGSPSPLVMSDFHQLTAHEGLITSLCFSPKALFTASKDLVRQMSNN
jgi:hypothetical protein